MKRKITILLFPCLLFICAISAQENNDNTIENQFSNTVDKSNSYQEFKVVPKVKLNALRKSVLDSISELEQTIVQINTEIDSQKNKIDSLTSELSTTQQNLVISKEKEDGIALMGSMTKKSTYNTIMWSIIGGLFLALMFMIFRFRSSNAVTKQSLAKLSETESDFEAHRQKTLENEQVLRRKLQDEINKNRKV